jgi:hypothetical protein
MTRLRDRKQEPCPICGKPIAETHMSHHILYCHTPETEFKIAEGYKSHRPKPKRVKAWWEK